MAPSTVKRARPRWRRIVWAGAALCAALLLLYHSLILIRIFRLRRSNPATTALMDRRARQAAALAATPKKEHAWVPYENISPSLARAVVAGEDLRFFYHSGLDWQQIRSALAQNWEERRFARGASTVTQQLAKNLFLSPSKNPARKLHEALIAKELELILGKRRILELYLNTIEWGDGIYGAEAASRHYFNTPAASLNVDQAAFLAAIIPNPRDPHDPSSITGKDRQRASRIRALMEHPLLVNFDLEAQGAQERMQR